MTHRPAPGQICELFEFVPDGQSRPPDGPGMYTWMLRRAQSAANLERITLPLLDNGTRAGLLAFPDDITQEIANRIAESLRQLTDFRSMSISTDTGNAFRASWKQGQHDWSSRAQCLVLGIREESQLFSAARHALEIAACDHLLVISPFRRNICLASASPPPAPTTLAFWPFNRKKKEWVAGMRPPIPLSPIRPFQIWTVSPLASSHDGGTIEIRHAHWLQLVRVLRAICPALTGTDEILLTDRSHRTLAADKTLALLLALRHLLQSRHSSGITISVNGVTFEPDRERWFWPQAESLYRLLCQGNGIAVA
jgi:hypothetical protein